MRWQDKLTCDYHEERDAVHEREGLRRLIEQQHVCNVRLWHLEDQARRRDVPDRVIVGVKRAIDKENQRRNDLIEKIDASILHALETLGENRKGELHSETLGSIIDRLSILSLKIYHVWEETQRADAGELYLRESRRKLRVLREQRRDLAGAYDRLVADVRRGQRRVKVYYQFKLYNRPQSNPALYKKEALRKSASAGSFAESPSP